ncbi:GtrA-like protein [Pseudovibrio axinellae]|uniref:GtrA-like protein n=1 Tax=Pseudovibrio axinellae TaxID=989403 RepID=A0A161V978_9HYPH|nr:GtrA family protein [Pseudovibrio axinellae]KZL21569.1 GtrA-like protein [Pseudovibrio axinellae]SER09926.1 dolichol-phosphate mannosyltransferase [Pseudovibrio axinellae]
MNYVIRRLLNNQFIRFGLVGVSGLFVDLLALAVLIQIVGLDPFIGRVLSIWVAMTNNWVWNRLFTFKSEGSRLSEYLRFVAVNSVGAVINYSTYSALIGFLDGFSAYLAVILATLVSMIFNFVLSKVYAFKA